MLMNRPMAVTRDGQMVGERNLKPGEEAPDSDSIQYPESTINESGAQDISEVSKPPAAPETDHNAQIAETDPATAGRELETDMDTLDDEASSATKTLASDTTKLDDAIEGAGEAAGEAGEAGGEAAGEAARHSRRRGCGCCRSRHGGSRNSIGCNRSRGLSVSFSTSEASCWVLSQGQKTQPPNRLMRPISTTVSQRTKQDQSDQATGAQYKESDRTTTLHWCQYSAQHQQYHDGQCNFFIFLILAK